MYAPLDYFTKKPEIYKVSNPKIVQRIAKKHFNIDVVLSPRNNKKYVFVNPDTNKYVHFGDINYEDFTYHKNIDRLNKFKLRNKRWKDAEKYSPAWASYFFLWN